MFVKFCVLIFLEISVLNSELVLEPSFKNVTVGGRTVGRNWYRETDISHAYSLKEDPFCNHLRIIVNIIGDLPVLQESSVTDLHKLEEFWINGSNLNEIKPGAFRNLTKLNTVKINNCKLTRIETGTFNDLVITHLRLDHNNINFISTKAFENMTKLELVDLSFNALSTWDNLWFLDLQNLNVLTFSHNKFEEIPDNAFQNVFLTNNATVEFAHNKIVNVGRNLFKNCTTIISLDLSNNQIETFGDDVLIGVQYLDTLNLSGNRIKCFYGDVKRIFLAELTNAENNPIECVSKVSKWQESYYIWD